MSRLLGERQQAFEALTTTLSARVEDIESMLQSFSALIEDGVVKKINIEDSPGKAEASSAEALVCTL